MLPEARLDSRNIDLLSEVSGGTVTEIGIATRGATAGKPVGDDVWTYHNLPPTGWNNLGAIIEDMLKRSHLDGAIHGDGAVYGSISLYSPREQNTTMYVGGKRGVKVWLNGTAIYRRRPYWHGNDYQDFVSVALKQGRNVLLVAVSIHDDDGNGFLGLNRVRNIPWQIPVLNTPFLQQPFIVARRLPSIFTPEMSRT